MGAQGCGEHVSGDLIAGDLTVGEFSPVKAPPLFCLIVMWRQVDCGTHVSVTAGCMGRVHLAVAPEWKFDFLYLFFSQILLLTCKNYI